MKQPKKNQRHELPTSFHVHADLPLRRHLGDQAQELIQPDCVAVWTLHVRQKLTLVVPAA